MKKLKAFSLLETILSIAIIGLISSSFSLLFLSITRYKKIKLNEQKYHYIRISVQNYVLQHGKLPMASENTLGISSSSYHGFVPYKTLGIAKSYMLDANNKPFRYVINPIFADTNIPIHVPLNYKPDINEKSFMRLYKYDNNVLIYDYYMKFNQIEIFDKENSIISKNDFFYVLPPISAPFPTAAHFYQWIKQNYQKEENKVSNVVAWILISFGKNTSSNEHKINKTSTSKFYITSANSTFADTLFFQSRFDLLAQIGFYSTPEPIYDDK